MTNKEKFMKLVSEEKSNAMDKVLARVEARRKICNTPIKYYPEGKDIYEGDIFSWGKGTGKECVEYGVIVWDEHELSYVIHFFSIAGGEGCNNWRLRGQLSRAKYVGNYYKEPQKLRDYCDCEEYPF